MPEPAQTILREWMEELRTVHHFCPDDPVFPQTVVGLDDEHQFDAKCIVRTPWSTASPVRKIFKDACALSDLP